VPYPSNRVNCFYFLFFIFYLSLFSFIFAILQIPVSNTRLLIKGIVLYGSFFILKYI